MLNPVMRFLILPLCCAAALCAAESKAYFSDPCPSPDGSEIAFVSAGDIWTVPAKGGIARLLVSHPATESRPMYSPDGKKLAFVSTRTGNGDIYVLTFAGGELQRLTFSDGMDQLDGWSRDGRWIYFSTSSGDISGMNDVLRVASDGGTPMPVAADRYASEYFSAPAPDGKTLAITARGIANSQWWRKGHSHLDESEIWLVDIAGATPQYRRFSDGGDAKEAWPMWSRDGRSLYYMSDRGGAQNIWEKALSGRAKPITHFTAGRVVWPAISYDGRVIAFERDFGVWKLDTETGKAEAVNIERWGAPAGEAVQHLSLTNQFQNLALSPDGKKIAFTAHGEVFAAGAKDGGEAQRITRTEANETQVEWSPDSRRLLYVSDREGAWHLFEYDFASGKETQLTSGGSDIDARYSPDGKRIVFERNGRELRLLDLESKQETALVNGRFAREPGRFGSGSLVWSPDNKWIAYVSGAARSYRHVYVVPAAGGASHQVSFLANVSAGGLSWSSDGTFLLFTTGQRTEPGQLARIDLIPRTPHFREDEFRDLFREPVKEPPPVKEPSKEPAGEPGKPLADDQAAHSRSGKAAPAKPVTIVFEGIRERLSLLPVGLDISSSARISPDGKTALLSATAAGQQNLYTYSLDDLAKEPAVARQLTSTPGMKAAPQFSPDGKQVFYLEQGRVGVVSLDTRQPKPLAVSAQLDVDFSHEKMEVFKQAWSLIRDNFFDPHFHGVNWEAARAEYEPYIAGAQTPDEERRLISLMLGELNASHSGISAPPRPDSFTTGRLGVRFDRAAYEADGSLKIAEVLPLGPAALAGIKTGDVIQAVDGTAVERRTNLDKLLDHTVNRRTVLALAAREAVVRPVSTNTEKGLLYRDWVERKRAYVNKISGGKLGYAHMQDMSANALAQLALDLDAENQSKEGVVIDVRNNNGGFVNVYAIDVLSRRGYLKMTSRDEPESPARSVLGQRSLEAPTVLVTNQHSLSDAEDFTEGYRALKLGKVVGEPTAGWIIYTGAAQLIDGSSLRLPGTRITDASGHDMEMHPRPVDIEVVRPVGESYSGRDSQLDAAVRELLSEISK